MYYQAPPSPAVPSAWQPRPHHPGALNPLQHAPPHQQHPPPPSPFYPQHMHHHPQHHHVPHHQHHASLPWGSPPMGMGGTLQNGNGGGQGNGQVQQGVGQGQQGQQQMREPSPEMTKNWETQLRWANHARMQSAPHHRARQSAYSARAQTTTTTTKVLGSAIPITDPNAPRPASTSNNSSAIPITAPPPSNTPNPYPGPSSTPAPLPIPNGVNGHHAQSSISSMSSLNVVEPRPAHPTSTLAPVPGHAPTGPILTNGAGVAEGAPTLSNKEEDKNPWTILDMGGMQLKSLSPRLCLFTYLRTLYMNHNRLTTLPPQIGALKNLTHLDLTSNALHTLPPEIGQLTALRELLLFDNNLSQLPHEIGTLHQLEILGIDGNPLPAELRAILAKDGTPALVAFLRDAAPVPTPPPERLWRDLPLPADAAGGEPFTLVCYNVLSERAAPSSVYGYTPSWALAWDFRKELILAEVLGYDAEIVCLQEVEWQVYEDEFFPALSAAGYDGVFWPKSKAHTMGVAEGRRVDGCATFFKRDRFQLIEKSLIDFRAIAVQRPDFAKTDDLFSRLLNKDHIAVVCTLENRQSGTRLVVANAHIHWDPLYADVKLVQTALLMDELDKIASRFATLPPRLNVSPDSVSLPDSEPEEGATTTVESDGERDDDVPDSWTDPRPKKAFASQSQSQETDADPAVSPTADPAVSPTAAPAAAPPSRAFPQIIKGIPMGPHYSDGTKIPTIIAGDFNSIPSSGLYNFLSTGALPSSHPEFMGYTYGDFTRRGLSHRLKLRSAYADVSQMQMTNFTPSFEGQIDYIWYTTDSLAVRTVLGEVSSDYLSKVVGFPNAHFPSDHICLAAEFRLKVPPRDAPASDRPPPRSAGPVFHPNGHSRSK